MGSGYWILIADGFGSGLVLLNPRLLSNGVDMYGNEKNWYPCDKETSNEEIINLHNLEQYKFFKIIKE